MFCENCGQPNPDGAGFCERCGAALAAPVIAPEPVKKKKTGLIIGGVIALFLVIALALCIFVFDVFTPGSVKTAEKFWNAFLKADAKTAYALCSPYYRDSQEADRDKADVIAEIDESLEEQKEEYEDDGIKRSVEDFKVKKKYKKNEVKAIEEYLEEEYYECDEGDYKIQEIHLVSFEKVEKGDGDKDSNRDEIVMLKIKGKWYVEQSLYKDKIKEILND